MVETTIPMQEPSHQQLASSLLRNERQAAFREVARLKAHVELLESELAQAQERIAALRRQVELGEEKYARLRAEVDEAVVGA